MKNLGVIFDDKLSRRPYIEHVSTKLSSGSWTLLKLRNYVDLNTLKTVYYSLSYSHLQYCTSTWGMASRNALDPLKKLQKRIVRIITKNSYAAHSNPLF